MDIKDVKSTEFQKYGFVLEGYDFSELLDTLVSVSKKPLNRVIYIPGDPALEALAFAGLCESNLYGGMPVQVGYCNGYNKKLNCLEYHRGSELNIAADDVILLVAQLQKVQEGKLDTAEVEAFLLPAGMGVLLYETTMHYAPCCAEGTEGFRVVIVLPKATNTDKPEIEIKNLEDRMLRARNKWLIAHPDAPEAASGAFVGLMGKKIEL